MFQGMVRANQVSFVTGMPSGIAEEVQLTLASQCKPVNDGRTVRFSNDASADLSDPKQRMAFVLKAAEQFDRLLNGAGRAQITQSIQVIASGGGVQ